MYCRILHGIYIYIESKGHSSIVFSDTNVRVPILSCDLTMRGRIGHIQGSALRLY